MTGKEALRLVADFEEARVRYLSVASDDATLKLVARWRLQEREAFDELVAMAGIAPPPERKDPAGRARDQRITNLVNHFVAEWSTHKDAAALFGLQRRQVMQILGRAARRRGFVVLREIHPEHGLRWKAVPKAAMS